MNTTHIMVDLETWGTTPGSDIRSIGAVVFDPITGTLGDEFYVAVENPAGRWRNGEFDTTLNGRMYPLTRDPSTVQWWSEQSDAAQAAFGNRVDLKLGLARFSDWWADKPSEATFWAHGPHFDEAILAACYRATGLPVPWHYRAPRDTRTIYEAAGGVDLPFEGTEHNALDDAKHQARCVIEAYRRLRAPVELLREAQAEIQASMGHYAAIAHNTAYRDASSVNQRITDYFA